MTELFTGETTWKRRGKPALIRVSKYGHIRFSVAACKNLGLIAGDKICFYIDYRDRDVVYFFKDNKRGMGLIHCTRGKEGVAGLQICCRPMSMKILDHFSFTENKTFGITNETVRTEHGEAWLILKDRLHKPIKWKKKMSNIL